MPQKMSLAEHEQLATLMNSLSLLAQKIERTRSTFPNYCTHLEEQYRDIMSHARKKEILPPWM